MMGSPTPFPANLYNHLSGGMSLPHRVLANQAFSTNNLPHNFHLSFQQTTRPQPISPNSNRSLLAISNTHGLLKQPNNPLNNNILTGSNTLSGIGGFARQFNEMGGSGVGSGGPTLDYSQFPSLSVRASSHNQVMPARNYVSMVSKQDTTSEFQIQQEDFPALPGAQNPNTSNLLDNSIKQSSYEAKEGGKSFADKTVGQRRGIQTHSDGTLTNVPSSMVGDQFGMVGLLTFIRAADTDPNLVALAPGIDLTTLGLNLNQSEALFTCFQSPWSDLPCRPQDIDYHVPSEYHTNMYVRDKLAPLRLSRYNEDLLFFLFYLYGGDLLQLAAAAELYNRDWRYHKEERLWMTRAPGMEPTQKSREHERGTYFFFDSTAWRKVAKEFHLEYSKLEEKPQLPDSLFSVNNNTSNNNNNNNPVSNSNNSSATSTSMNNATIATTNNNFTSNFLALNNSNSSNNNNFVNNSNNNNNNNFFNAGNNFVGFNNATTINNNINNNTINNNPPNSTSNLTTSRTSN